ncbi:MAG: MerR family transcriptional regulator [Acidimicrobiia bacterium]|nr:MerR family transcriptional regulator [Acidimicrobiia bacterium]
MTTDRGGATHQIGEVAEAVGLSLRTIRHYEEVGLVPPSARSAGGFRLYSGGDIDRLRLVKDMKPLDFTLEEMRDLLEVRDQLADGPAPKARDALAERLRLYAVAAAERCAQLREQLGNAEAFASRLADEAETGGGRSYR